MGKRLLPWATGLPKVPWPCAKGTGIAVDRGLLPWAEGFCVGRGLLLGAGELLPWAKGYCRGQKLKLLLDFQAGQLIVKPPGPLVSRLALQAFTKHKPPLHRKHTHVLAQRQNDISTT